MKTSTVFRAAKRHLVTTRLQGICTALRRARGIPSEKVQECSRILQDRIAPETYATTWIASQLNVSVPYRWYQTQDPRELQAWRRKWLDLLIEEFELKGD